MEQEIKRIVRRLFPELTGDYHLPHFARVEAISDPLVQGELCEDFRPRYAVDLVVLTPQGEANEELPLFRAVPLPASCGGMERGQLGFPEPGTLVEVGFAYGLPHKPFIRTVLPHGLSLPDILPGDQVNQTAPGVYDRTHANGDKERTTHGAITDQASKYFLDALNSLVTLQEQHIKVGENSTEEIAGIKIIEALGALKLLSGGTLNLAAADNLNQTTASDLNTTVGKDIKERVGNIRDSLAKSKHLIKVKDGGTVWVGSESINVLQILSSLIQVVSDIANMTASHTHPNVGACTQGSAFTGYTSSADSLKGQLDPVVE